LVQQLVGAHCQARVMSIKHGDRYRSVAWAPFTHERLEWLHRRDDEAATWIMRRSRAEARRPVLRVDTDATHWRRDPGPVGLVGRAGSVVTNRSGSGSGPTLAYNPTDRCMASALACARGYSIVAVEHPSLPLHGWAAAVGAIDLRTGDVVADPLNQQQRDRIDSIVRQAYNGWKAARRFVSEPMAELADAGVTWWDFVGTVFAVEARRVDFSELRALAPAPWRAEDEAWTRRILEP
jgi:hypothetical protein